MGSGQYLQVRLIRLGRSGQVEQSFLVGRVLVAIEQTIVRVCTETERVTGLQDPLVSSSIST